MRGFTLIELMTALLVLSLLALMSYRGLGAVLEAREHVAQETDEMARVAAFFARFQRDVQLSAPRPILAGAERLEFSRFAATEGVDAPRRVGYRLNESREIELWLWPGLDARRPLPARYPVLAEVRSFELRYLDGARRGSRPGRRAERDPPIPQAVRLRVVLASGEDLVRVFALQ